MARSGNFSTFIKKAHSAGQNLAQKYRSGQIRLINELCEAGQIDILSDIADQFMESAHIKIHDVILVGIGGSILSPCLFMPFARRNLRIHTLIVPDPLAAKKLLEQLDPARTRILIMSKSGQTAETLSLFLCLLNWLEDSSYLPRENIIAICEKGDSALRRLAQSHNMRILDGEADINSRFSLFTAIGMFPALIAGLDAEMLRRAAREITIEFFDAIEKSETHDILTGAAFNVWGGAHGKNIHAMITADPRLWAFNAWWQQIFAESLGKNEKAMTPIEAQLPNDLHIRFQLYLDGPDDKIFTCLTGSVDDATPVIHARGEKTLHWLDNHRLSDLMHGQEEVALASLTRKQRPMRIIQLSQMDEAVYGRLLMHFVLEILLIAECWNISPFGQPAIEQGKIDLVEFMRQKN